MYELIEQRIPGGCHTPVAQAALSQEVVREAARLLEFSAMEDLEDTLRRLHTPMVALAAAGVLSEIAFYLVDGQGSVGVSVTVDPYDVEDYEAVDLSRLALLSRPEACGRLEIMCLDMPLARSIVGEGDLLSLATDALAVTLMRGSAAEDAILRDLEEENHEYDDEC